MRKLLIVVVLLAAVVVGGVYYWRQRATPAGTAADSVAVAADTPLAFVPADTPYVFANLEPMPRPVTDRWMAQMDEIARLWRTQLAQGAKALETEQPNAEALKWMRALETEIAGKTMTQVLTSAGYDLQSHFAFYGIGLAPVMRVTLADPDAFRAFLARLEKNAGATLPRAKLGELEYWHLSAPEAKLRGVMAVQDRHLVLTLAPPADDTALRTLLGVDRPAKSLEDGGALVALNRELGYLPYGGGYVDTTRLAALLTAPATPLETAFLTAFGVEKPPVDAVCSAEYAALAAAFPRLSLGYTALDTQRMDMVARMETNAAIAQDLMTLRAPMPGLKQAQTAPLNFGFSLRLGEMPKIVNKWADAVAATPWQCPQLAALNEGFAQGRTQLNNPGVFMAAPVFHGFHAIATRLEIKSMDTAPDFGGKLLIGSDNPAGLVNMAKGFVPQLAKLNLVADGKVHALPAMPDMPANLPTHAAMTEHVLAIAVGQGEESDLTDYLIADPTQQPLLALGYSGALFADFYRQMFEQTSKSIPDEATRAQMKETAEVMAKMYSQIRRTELRVEFTDRGIEFVQTAELN